MNAPGDPNRFHQQALDFVFARLGGNATVEPPAGTEGRPGETGEASASSPPPEIRSPEDFKAAAEWLQRERQRLEGYTRNQLARVQEERQSLMQQHYLNEQTLVFRSQDLAQREEMLQSQGRAIQQQQQELGQREQSLVGQLQHWWQANEELSVLQETTQSVRDDAAKHQAMLEALRSETEAANRAREDTRAELASMLAKADELRQSRAREESCLKARQAQLEQRLHAADHTVLAAEQRLAELDDLEARLRRECEDQERGLYQQRKELEEREKQWRGERGELLALRGELEKKSQDIDHRQAELLQWHEHAAQLNAELEQIEAEVARRAAEVREQEGRLREERRAGQPPEPARAARAPAAALPRHGQGRVSASFGKQ